ncbi:MAG: VOC family protein [Actinobacteria bacterium]|nr:VOC family protein [Actinomycetota bacterium]
MTIKRLNHAVLYVRDAKASAVFYTEVLGFVIRANMGDKAIFLQADGSDNDHDLGLFSVGERGAPSHSVGLYHLAWQVHTLEELSALREKLIAAGALVGESDHGVSKSLYARDLDGIEFEVMWAVPRADWPATVGTWHLDLEAALARWPQVDTADQVQANRN